MRADRERLLDILEAIERISKYAAQGREAFFQNELIQVWVIYHLQIIGEAARALSEERRAETGKIIWSKMIGMRNILVHGYFTIDPEIVWAVVENDLDGLREAVENLISELESE